MPDAVRVVLTPGSVQMEPGKASEVTITIQNPDSGTVGLNIFSIRVLGIDSSWYALDPAGTTIMPGHQANSILTFNPPRASSALAGTYPFTVTVTPQYDTTQETSVMGTLELLPIYSFSTDVHPQEVTGARGTYTLSIKNTGSIAVPFELAGRDREALCRYVFDPEEPIVPPGETVAVSTVVEPGQRPLWGRARVYNFDVTVSPKQGSAEPETKGGIVLKATRRLAWWAFLAVGIYVLAVIALIALVLLIVTGGIRIQGDFSLAASEERTLAFNLPAEELKQIRLEYLQQQGTVDVLGVTLFEADRDPVTSVMLTPPTPGLAVVLDVASTRLGVSGGEIFVKNSDAGRADVSLRLKGTRPNDLLIAIATTLAIIVVVAGLAFLFYLAYRAGMGTGLRRGFRELTRLSPLRRLR